MHFHPGLSAIIRRATLLALAGGADSVGVAHLLECEMEGEPEPVVERDISFDPEMLEILKLAAQHAEHDESSAVQKAHLELALLMKTACLPPWSGFRPLTRERFSRVLVAAARQVLRIKRIELMDLLRDWTKNDFPFGPAQLTGPDILRFKGHARLAKGMGALPVLIALTYVLSGGPLGEMLRRNGMDESLLSAALGEPFPLAPAREDNGPLDFRGCLGSGVDHLSLESKNALALAWVLRDGEELSGRDLLRALIANSNQLEEHNVHNLLDRLRPQIRFAEQLVNQAKQSKFAPPLLSAEVYRTFHIAMREAAPDQKVTPLDLLVGLAECGQSLLAAAEITAGEIRQGWQE